MILGFKKVFPWGEPTEFERKIIYFLKVHTIRNGQRWKAGNTIQMATGVRTKSYYQFNNGGYCGLDKVKSVQRIDIIFRSPEVIMIFIDRKLMYCRNRAIEFQKMWFLDFLQNDGFDNADQFWKWFTIPVRNGQLIHWTDLKY